MNLPPFWPSEHLPCDSNMTSEGHRRENDEGRGVMPENGSYSSTSIFALC